MTEIAEPFDRATPVAPLAIPVLLTTDLTRSILTYEALGFEVKRAGADYLIARGYGVEFHISRVGAIPTPHCVSAYLRVPDADALYQEFNRAAPGLASPADKPWGMREFHYIDPDGNLINVGAMVE